MKLPHHKTLFEGKTIIFGGPRSYNLDKAIENELSGLGFNIINISFDSNQFRYKHVLQRLVSFVARDIFRIKTFKNRIKFNTNKRWINRKLENVALADYTLIIRPDVYPLDFIKALRTKSRKLIAYQWDGLDRHPEVYNYIDLFDRFFVFDGSDLRTGSVMPITNFYFETLSNHQQPDENFESDVWFTGSFSRHRIHLLGQLISDCRALNQRVRYHLYHRRNIDVTPYNLQTAKQILDYTENIRYAFNTRIILDFVNPSHRGLSFRFFEALRFGKKIITTNSHVKHYDFYHPDNIFIWENNAVDDLDKFINKPYQPLPDEILKKYSFSNWLQYALDKGNYLPLSIP